MGSNSGSKFRKNSCKSLSELSFLTSNNTIELFRTLSQQNLQNRFLKSCYSHKEAFCCRICHNNYHDWWSAVNVKRIFRSYLITFKFINNKTNFYQDGFVVRYMNPNSPSTLSTDLPLKLARKTVEVFGSATFDEETNIHPLHTGFDDEIAAVVSGKEFSLARTTNGKVRFLSFPILLFFTFIIPK